MGMSIRLSRAISLVLCVVIVTLVAAILHTHTRAAPRPAVGARNLVGRFSEPDRRSAENCTISLGGVSQPSGNCEPHAAIAGVKGGGVSCRWLGSNVLVHVVLRNRSRTKRVKVLLGPRVQAGHARSTADNDIDVTLAPAGRIVLDLVAAFSRDVRPGSRLRSCAARMINAYVVDDD